MVGRGTRFLTQIVLVRTGRDSWTPAVFWLAAAAVSVSVAVVVALQPGELQDLHLVRKWLEYWTTHLRNPYPYFGQDLDYPPLAFLLLWPLSLPSDATVAFWYLPVSIALTIAAGWMLLRWISERIYIQLSTPERIALVAMMLAGGGARSSWHLGQTVALSLLFGALAMRWKRRRPVAAAIALALCSFKPNIAFGFGLAILINEGVGVPLLAGGIIASFSLLFAAIVGAPPLDIGAQYLANLIAMYEGIDRESGMLSLRRVFDDLVHDYLLRSIIYAVIAMATLITIIKVSRARRFDATTQAQVAVACLLWSVLFLPNQIFNSMMVVPALWLMMWPEAGLVRRQSIRIVLVAAYILFGVLHVPQLVRAAATRLEFGWMWDVSYLLSPLRMAAVFLVVVRAMYRGLDVLDPDASAGTWRIGRLLNDPVIRTALVVWLPLAAVYFIPGVPIDTLERIGDTYSTLPLWPVAIAAALVGIGRVARPWERRVWIYQAASFTCLMGIEAARVAMPNETVWWNVASDWSYVLYYAFQMLAAVQAHRVARVAGLTRRQTVACVGLCGLGGAVVTWLAAFRPEVHADGLPSFLLYVMLDAWIVVLFLRAGREAIDARWRRACRGLALASVLFCAVDLAELFYYRGTWTFGPGTIIDLAWTLPTMCYIVAIRLVRFDQAGAPPAAVRSSVAASSGPHAAGGVTP